MSGIPVFYETALVGTITVAEEGPSFAYDPRWADVRGAFPVSLRIPLGSEAPPAVLVPWLQNLLPEGVPLLTVGQALGISPQDVVGMVEKIGRDTAGALSVSRPRRGKAPRYRPVPDEAALERIIAELPAKPFLVGDEGVSMSLAGAQQKLPLAFANGRFAIPIDGAPSTHILKPDNSRLYGSVQNEALCLVLARRVGLSASTVTTGVAGERSYLLVTRYDRLFRNGRWLRLHQEDFCQALGKSPGAKYEHNRTGIKGPSLKDFFALARQHMEAGDVIALLRAVILNVLLTNVDSHAKNYSILLSARGARLAPLYDLMCGAAWANVTQNMAQDIGDKNRGRYIYARHWRRMAETCGLSGTAVLHNVAALAEKVAAEVVPAMEEVESMPAGSHPMLKRFAGEIVDRCALVAKNLREDGPQDDFPDESQEDSEPAPEPRLDEIVSSPSGS
ncbi:Type II toxin-antitoxin system HipA family toxin (plasmid) [Rhodovastum atsumiense]|uniref:Type II toxin-antitoxin system HipA family toxin n=1 Tax=Rhodovastum atsumiense TaxID=504468 RepID=A0A5M6IKT7_9PROT|nr:type II toxin-antitoxin system HipA family toxin [Rhodovastum atsumiense]KAA5608265.1 type II toxin-antitoxin system HipA family toxin [Rhodovastum atsumiense]CAH2605676.1 Type II toxin-antitoxin system HipA family toxin [Rhodovastum atsumiense]